MERTNQKQSPEVLLTIYKGILKNSSKFTGKHLYESLFLNVAFEILFFFTLLRTHFCLPKYKVLHNFFFHTCRWRQYHFSSIKKVLNGCILKYLVNISDGKYKLYIIRNYDIYLLVLFFVLSSYQISHLLTYQCANHCVKRVRIQSYSGPYFPTFGLNTGKCGPE